MKKPLISLCLTAVLLSQSGCGPRPAEETGNPQAEDADPPAEEASSQSDFPTPPPGMPYHGYRVDRLWPVEEINERHAKLFMKALPEYVIGLAGRGGEAEEGGFSSNWAFIVPQDKIQEFRGYLVELGVPEEYLDKEAAVASMSRPLSWRLPDPPATELVFMRSFASRASVTLAGLEFVKGQTWLYYLENPNLVHAYLDVTFDPVTGNTMFNETYRDRRASGDFSE